MPTVLPTRSASAGTRTRKRVCGSPHVSMRARCSAASSRALASEGGYEAVTISAVCDRAGVARATLYHYFGSKQQLFVAAMEIPYHWQRDLPAVLEGPFDEIGQRLVRQLLAYWEDPRINPLFRGVVRSAATDPVAAGILLKSQRTANAR